MKDPVEKLEEKIDKLDARLDSIDKTLALNTQSLIEHSRRTHNLEDRVEPIEKHVLLVNACVKIGAALIGLSGSVVAIIELFRLFK